MKTLLSLLSLAIVIGSGPAFAADQVKTAKSAEAKGATKAEAKVSEAKASPAKVSKEKGQDAALKLVPGELLCWDLQVEDGIPEYAFYIKGKDGRISEVELDGNTGKKTNIGILIDSQSSDGRKIKTTNAADRARLKEAKLTIEQTQEKALKAYPGTVEAWEILIWESGKEGKLVHDFRVIGKDGKKVVTVNSKTGEIISISRFVDGKGR
ncbi:PepSY domain-containing protein [Candidatus Obscuribacterales bacterium]|nr:PepSY domain-containing protein [Candidatus Obscuribacterales bacterium]MBX3152662.1 PepSY domain-containing protein [Candidatus Obscuribacterales bacterium]